MKYALTFLFIVLLHDFIYSQAMLHEDSYNLSGGFSFSITDRDHPEYTTDTKSVVFNPALTYHLLDILSVGGSISYNYTEEKIDNGAGEQKSIERIFNIRPTVRYYFHNQNLAPFVECSLGYSSVLAEKNEGYSISLGAGINYFFTKSIALEPQITYVISSYVDPDYN